MSSNFEKGLGYIASILAILAFLWSLFRWSLPKRWSKKLDNALDTVQTEVSDVTQAGVLHAIPDIQARLEQWVRNSFSNKLC